MTPTSEGNRPMRCLERALLGAVGLAMVGQMIVGAIEVRAAGLPQDAVMSLDDALIAAMKAGKAAGFSGRAALLEPAIDRSFDVIEMTRLTLGSAGKSLLPEQMAKIAEAFRKFTIASYARNFDGFGGERFELEAARPAGPHALVVPSRLIPGDGAQPVQLDYVLKESGDKWKITDVLAEGAVSQMAARRAEFTEILRRDGVDGLIAALDSKTKALAAEPKAPTGDH
jgi:phospholipid transport system substrate-binding protein